MEGGTELKLKVEALPQEETKSGELLASRWRSEVHDQMYNCQLYCYQLLLHTKSLFQMTESAQAMC
jgi:hypothetical protein